MGGGKLGVCGVKSRAVVNGRLSRRPPVLSRATMLLYKPTVYGIPCCGVY